MYKKAQNTDDMIIRLADDAHIPCDEGNADYRSYLAWVDEGNTINPADPVDEKPILIAAAKAALLASDQTLIRCVEAKIAFPAEWVDYRQSLRMIAAGKNTGPLPSVPPYPEG